MNDLIERQAVLEGLANIAKAKAKSDAQKSLMGRTMFFVERLPSVSAEKTGRWKKISPANIYECSECGQNVMTDDICAYNICHGCGAEMEVENGTI